MRKNEIVDALNRIEQKMDSGFDRVDGILGRLGNLESRFDGFENRFDEFRKETLDRFDFLFNKIDLFNTEYYAITAGMRRIEDEHRIIGHVEILKELNHLKSQKDNSSN